MARRSWIVRGGDRNMYRAFCSCGSVSPEYAHRAGAQAWLDQHNKEAH